MAGRGAVRDGGVGCGVGGNAVRRSGLPGGAGPGMPPFKRDVKTNDMHGRVMNGSMAGEWECSMGAWQHQLTT